MSKILYITYDGLTDPLGQSQVLPYLKGLSQKGYDITILSCEKKENFNENKETISEQIKECNLKWEYIFYLKNPPILSTILNIFNLRLKAFLLHKKNNFNVIHCRSYIASLIGLEMKKKFNTKFIFDMRGFWADERVEGGLWNLSNPLYKIIYNYFKKKEIEFLTYADYTISLTEKAKQIIHTWKEIPHQPIPIEVIPCSVDINHFSIKKIDKKKLDLLRINLGIKEDDFVLTYLGSIDTWYLLDKMLYFFKEILIFYNNAKFLLITQESPKTILQKANQLEIPKEKIIIQKAKRQEIPNLLSLTSIGIFFYKPGFSRVACSPTKFGEMISMGIPVICNANVGDLEKIIKETNVGACLYEFSDIEIKTIISQIDNIMNKNKEEIINTAIKYFSLENGIEKYSKIYSYISI